LNTTWRVLVGDVRDKLAELPAGSVQCCVTSPPYFGLRDYGVAGQIGLELSPADYIAELVALFSLAREAMREDATLWLNLGDSYAGSWGAQSRENPGNQASSRLQGGSMLSARQIAAHPKGTHTGSTKNTPGLKPKDLMGIPWRVALALQADGWYLRSDIIWHKPNPMPESVTDRPTKSHEYVFLLTKAERYYYDAEAIAEPADPDNYRANPSLREVAPGQTRQGKLDARRGEVVCDTRNARSVWTINTAPYPEAHFATFPEALPERCIKAGSKEGDTVLDPFCGSGTTGAVSMRLGRNFVGIELNPAYAELSRKRIGSALPMFSQEVPA
jgi:DNA modification methylase